MLRRKPCSGQVILWLGLVGLTAWTQQACTEGPGATLAESQGGQLNEPQLLAEISEHLPVFAPVESLSFPQYIGPNGIGLKVSADFLGGLSRALKRDIVELRHDYNTADVEFDAREKQTVLTSYRRGETNEEYISRTTSQLEKALSRRRCKVSQVNRGEQWQVLPEGQRLIMAQRSETLRALGTEHAIQNLQSRDKNALIDRFPLMMSDVNLIKQRTNADVPAQLDFDRFRSTNPPGDFSPQILTFRERLAQLFNQREYSNAVRDEWHYRAQRVVRDLSHLLRYQNVVSVFYIIADYRNRVVSAVYIEAIAAGHIAFWSRTQSGWELWYAAPQNENLRAMSTVAAASALAAHKQMLIEALLRSLVDWEDNPDNLGTTLLEILDRRLNDGFDLPLGNPHVQ